jgi:glycerol uptake facilitator-like aquaporin
MTPSIGRRALAEFIGTAFLVMAVIGSGIAAAKLSPGDVGLELFENAVVTGAALVAIILALGSVSGAHLNPVITGLDRVFGGISSGDALVYVVAQIAGGVLGAVVANLMFGLRAVELSTQVRTGHGLWLGEAVATLGLALVVFGMVRSRRTLLVPFAVGAYITAAYFFTSSTSFANPAVTFARMFSNTFAGIAPSSVPGFIAFQLVGAVIALGAIKILFPDMAEVADEVVVPHPDHVEAGAVATEAD